MNVIKSLFGYIALIKRLAFDDKLDFDTAKILISEYRKQLKQGE